MTLYKKCVVWWMIVKLLFISFFVIHQSYAQTTVVTPPATNSTAYWSMNRALAGITQSALEARGYIASDPRTYATLRGMSTTAASIAGGTAAATVGAVAVAGITAPAWGSILLVSAVSALVGVGVQLAVSGLMNWLFRTDNKIDTNSTNLPYPSCALGDLNEYWYINIAGLPQLVGCDGKAIALEALNAKYPVTASQQGKTTCVDAVTVISCSNATGSMVYSTRVQSKPVKTCPAGNYLSGTNCVPYTYPQISAVPAATAQSMQQAVNTLPASDLPKPLNPQLVAATANTLWQQAAAQTGYAGIPYPVSNPITTAEATTWMNANSSNWPTVNDFVSPRSTTTTTATPWSLPSNPGTATATPSLSTSPNTSVSNGSTQPLINLGDDPAIPSPTLEPIPTAQQILDPVLNMLPSHRSFLATNQSGVCPSPTINLYGTHTLNAHCLLIEQNKSVIQLAMTFAWSVIALFIVLSA